VLLGEKQIWDLPIGVCDIFIYSFVFDIFLLSIDGDNGWPISSSLDDYKHMISVIVITFSRVFLKLAFLTE
jgi:hypothetical protein